METKNTVLSIIGAIFAVFIVALIVFNVNESNSDTETNLPATEDLEIHEQYEGLPEDNRFIEEAANQIVDRFENGSGAIFLGFKECPWCQKVAPILNQAAEDEGVPVYYLDIRQEREDNSPLYQRLVEILKPYLRTNDEGGVRISVPDISIVKDGKILWRYEFEETTEEELTPESYWTAERESRALAQFREQMSKLKEE